MWLVSLVLETILAQIEDLRILMDNIRRIFLSATVFIEAQAVIQLGLWYTEQQSIVSLPYTLDMNAKEATENGQLIEVADKYGHANVHTENLHTLKVGDKTDHKRKEVGQGRDCYRDTRAP